MTVKQLANRVGAKVQSVHNLLSKMRGTKYRVAEWTRETLTGDWAARWELGTGERCASTAAYVVVAEQSRVSAAVADARRCS
jgi:hypothetical protein